MRVVPAWVLAVVPVVCLVVRDPVRRRHPPAYEDKDGEVLREVWYPFPLDEKKVYKFAKVGLPPPVLLVVGVALLLVVLLLWLGTVGEKRPTW